MQTGIIGLMFGIAGLGNDLQARILLAQPVGATHMIHMPLGKNQVRQRILSKRVIALLDDGRLEPHTGIDLNVARWRCSK